MTNKRLPEPSLVTPRLPIPRSLTIHHPASLHLQKCPIFVRRACAGMCVAGLFFYIFGIDRFQTCCLNHHIHRFVRLHVYEHRIHTIFLAHRVTSYARRVIHIPIFCPLFLSQKAKIFILHPFFFFPRNKAFTKRRSNVSNLNLKNSTALFNCPMGR